MHGMKGDPWDNVEKLLTLTKELSGNHLLEGPPMLLMAAAILVTDRATFMELAETAFTIVATAKPAGNA